MSKATPLSTNRVNTQSRATIRAGERRGATIPQMAAAILALQSTANALPSIEVRRRVPAAIAPAALDRNADFATMSAPDRECVVARGYVAPMELIALITRLESPSTAEVVSHTGGVMMLKIYDKPPPASAENLATAARLRKLHKVAVKHNNAVAAPARAQERQIAAIIDRATKIENRLTRAVSKSASDLVAKAGLYQSDPQQFREAAGSGLSVGDSLAHDVVSLLGWAVQS